jgi:hypothetical protein
MADQQGFWPIAGDLATLHDLIIEYAVRIQAAAAAKQERTAEGPVSHAALFTLHRVAIVTHRSIRSLCETGWTPLAPTLIRTLLDVLASCYVIVWKYEDSEYMAFKFMCSYLIQAIGDPDTSDDLRRHDREQLNKMRRQLKGPDVKRVDDFIAKFKPQPYWFCPEFSSPGRVFKDAIPHLFDMYRQFSGAVHGSLIGSVLFSDSPDAPSINPQENPVRTRAAIVASSRLLLDVSLARGTFEGIANQDEYKEIVRTYVLPQKDRVEIRLPDSL